MKRVIWMLVVLSSIVAVLMAIFAIFIRMKAAKKPVSAKKIILPPIFMSTGALMFIHPFFRVTVAELIEALTVGALFSILLIKTSNFEIKDEKIYLKRSKAFVFILFGLLIFRLVYKAVMTQHIPFGETSGMFFLLALGMIVPWRIAMLLSFKKLERKLNDKESLV